MTHIPVSMAAHLINQHFQNCYTQGSTNPSPSSSTTTNIANAWFVCMLMYCDTNYDRNPQYQGCHWYKDLAGKDPEELKQDIALGFQEFKNFLAIEQLEYVREKILDQVMAPPYIQQTKFSGFKFKVLQPFISDDITQRDWQLYIWDMFMPPSYTESKYVQNHYAEYCSFIDSEYIKKYQICDPNKVNRAMPDDVLAASLLGKSEIKFDTTEYIYKFEKNDIPRIFVVVEDEKEAFLAKYEDYVDKDAEPYRTYEGVNKQRAALSYIKNLTNGMPLPTLPDEKLYDIKDQFVFNKKIGEPYIAAKLQALTSTSLARQSLLKSYADRLPNSSVQDPKNVASSKSKTTSLLGLLEYESLRRYNNPDWHGQMWNRSEEAMVREIANILSLQMTVNFKVMKSFERIEALLAAQSSFGVGEVLKDQISTHTTSTTRK